MRIFTAILIGFGMALCLPLAAAEKAAAKAAPAKATVPAKAKANGKAKAAAPKKPVVTHSVQQRPSTERYVEIEQALVERGYLPEAHGAWDAASIAALKKFQEQQGLPVDGKLGSLSLKALGLGPRRGGTVEDAITAGVLPSGSAPTPLD